VYAGENQVARLLDRSAEFPVVEVAGSRITVPPERHFGDLAGVQRYVDAVLELDWVVRRWPRAAAMPVTVRERRGAAQAHYEPDTATIAVPVRGADARWALRELVVLHELAHHLASDAGGRQPRRDEVAAASSEARSEQSDSAMGARSEQLGTDAGPNAGGDARSAADSGTGHGPGFTGRMLELVGGVMGEEAAFLLRVAWADQGVRVG
jgi:putative metallohydrolase (TIGR04338 family)